MPGKKKFPYKGFNNLGWGLFSIRDLYSKEYGI